ncbi:lysylphosphatidylglycerol synthase transmembrane domain-containing protein [Bartonella sp. DGB2]|uniref:lysylphosphatidylglycerol synthase transmembrane domain-containing protein n=1 Tax=Bartonella sp. DGB2 TaxID=3388426 RepID=UPI00398FCA87
MKIKKLIWPLIGIIAMLISIRILYIKLAAISFSDVLERMQALDAHHWLLACFFAALAYAALAGYDRIALQHLGHKISWIFIAVCSFTTYALSHNIGASVFSGAVVRYRAYSKKGLTGQEVAVLVGFCSFTFVIGTILLSGIVLVARPNLIRLVHADIPEWVSLVLGVLMLAFVALYIFGSWLQLRPLRIGKKFQISYPNLRIVAQQLVVGPLEILGAAGIIYAVLPVVGNPGFLTILGVFLASFTATLLSNAPAGGVGVLEALFMAGLPYMNRADVIVALIIFRLLYLIIPLVISLFFVALFEINQYRARHSRASAD